MRYFLITTLFIFSLVSACDPWQKESCSWYLIPDSKNQDIAPKGLMTVCARNYDLGKQRCFLIANPKYAKSLEGKKFRYSSLKLAGSEFPKRVVSVQVCGE